MEEQRSEARAIIMRPGLGAAGRALQPTRLRAHRVTIDLPTLILVEEGRKRVQWTGGECTASLGDALAPAAGQVVEILNLPEPSGSYRARWISWSFEMLDSLGSSSTSIAPFAVATLLPRLTPEFRSAYRSAFDSLLDLAAVPAAVAEHRLREFLVWLQERGVCFPANEPERLSLRLRRLLLSDPAHPWSIEEVSRHASRGFSSSIDPALEALQLSRTVQVVVPGFPDAMRISAGSDLVALVPTQAWETLLSGFEPLRWESNSSNFPFIRQTFCSRRCGIREWTPTLHSVG